MRKIELKRKNSFVKIGFENNMEFQADTNIKAIIPTKNTINPTLQKLFIELTLPMHVSSYGLIGFDFMPNKINEFCIDVSICNTRKKMTTSSALDKSHAFVGLNEEYAKSILKATKEFFEINMTPHGNLSVCMGGYSDVNSSSIIFNIITKIALDIFINKDENITDQEVINICEKYLAARF